MLEPKKLTEGRCKVYLAKLKRTNMYPRCVYKVGITDYVDALSRLTYNRSDEAYPICKYFSDIKVMASIICPSKTQAEALEEHIMTTIRGEEQWFHNWRENDPISGITEMRRWNYDEIQKCFDILNEHKKTYYME